MVKIATGNKNANPNATPEITPTPGTPAGEPGAAAGAANAPVSGAPTAPAGEQTNPSADPAAVNAESAAAEAKAKKAKVAEHDWIDAKGDVVEELPEATGIKYRDQKADETFTWQVPDAKAGSVQTMMAVWGARTKATNSASAARQKRLRDNSYTMSDVAAIREAFGAIKEGQWEVPTEGKVKGPKYDLDVLASVITEALVKQGATPDLAKIREKCGDSPAYVRGAMGMPEIANEYNSRKNIAPKAVSSLMV